MKFVKGRGYKTYKTKEVEKEHKREARSDVETEVEQEAPFPLFTHVNNILHSIFSNVEVYINNQLSYKSNGLYANKSYNSNNFKGAIFENKGVLHCRSAIIKSSMMKLWKRFCLNIFSHGERNWLVDPMVSCCMGNWGWHSLHFWNVVCKQEN